ncbi:hypothetical protein [Poseidonocella sp. HB161398]|uniref:hypothetical protein n=1 Tax=Poseidonocella sp. HB161398 TaxID=2320855 RepID=UPI0011082138|nr:hypothetical protein [Poseidonocella sp. HB161398]
MLFEAEFSEFVSGAVMIILATSDATGRTAIGRGVGAWPGSNIDQLIVAISARQWPRVIADLTPGGPLAVTAADPASYETYQFKGNACMISANGVDVKRSGAAAGRMAARLHSLGISDEMSAEWLMTEDVQLAQMRVEGVWKQTPGPGAGVKVDR